MVRCSCRLLVAVLAFACLSEVAVCQTRSITIDDVVSLEAFGRASIAPDGAWAVYEKHGSYDTAPRYDRGPRSTWAIMELWLVDLRDPSRPPIRVGRDPEAGLVRGPWSPDGSRLVVYRLLDDRFEVGILAMSDRSVRWTGLTPEMPQTGGAVEWMSDDRLALMVRPDESLPWLLRYYGDSQARTAANWGATAAGRSPSRTMVDTDRGVVTPERSAASQALVLVDAGSGHQTTLTQGLLMDFSVSPDGETVAVLSATEPVPVEAGRIVQGGVNERRRLTIHSVDTTDFVTTDRPVDIAPHLLRWSPDSTALLVWGRNDGEGWSDGDLLRIDRRGRLQPVARGDLEPLGEGLEIDTLRGVRAEWSGLVPVLRARRPGSDRFDWYRLEDGKAAVALTADFSNPPVRIANVVGEAVGVFADGGYWMLDAEGVRRLTPPELEIGELAVVDPERAPRFQGNDAPRVSWTQARGRSGEILAVEADGSVVTLAEDASEARVLAVSPAATLVLRRNGMVETLRLETAGASRDLDRVNTGLSDVVLPEPTLISHPDVFGRPAQSWLHLPPGRSLDDVRGLIVSVYPGSVDSGRWTGPTTLIYSLRAQVLAGAGYAVLSSAIPIDREDTRSPDFYLRSVDAAVDATLAAYPKLPADRIAVFGHSFGGGAALAIAARTDRYRTYIAWAAPTDMFGKWGEFHPVSRVIPEEGSTMRFSQGGAEVGQYGLGGPPWVLPGAYLQASRFLSADRISAPVLLITADRDFVPMSQSERMFSALYRLGGRSRIVSYWGEEHILWSPANIRDLYGQVQDWLDETLSSDGLVSGTSTDDVPRPSPSPRTPQRP